MIVYLCIACAWLPLFAWLDSSADFRKRWPGRPASPEIRIATFLLAAAFWPGIVVQMAWSLIARSRDEDDNE